MKKEVMEHAFKARKKKVEGSPEEEKAETPDEEQGEVMAGTEVPESPNQPKKVPNAVGMALQKRKEKLKK